MPTKKKTAEKRPRTKAPAKPFKYKFDPRFDWWNSNHIANFHTLKEMYAGRNGLKFLEIGIFEGRSTVWFLDNCLTGLACQMHCIDPDEQKNTRHNFSKHEERVHWYQDRSHRTLPVLYSSGRRFDFIYIDGDHHGKTMLEDIVLSWRLLKVGGILLIDDYEMESNDPWFFICHEEFIKHPRLHFLHPRVAIDAFRNIYRGMFEVVFDNYQFGVRKTVELGGKNLVHGDDEQPADFSYLEAR